jgi:hypothetical protein
MAGEDLYGALAGLNYDPAETGYGTSSQVLASSLPNLMNPYQGAGTNIGIALGGALISGLLGYQARQSAAEQSLEANKLGLQLLEAQSPQARLGIIESTPDTVMQGKLLGVNTRLAAQQAAMKQLVDQEVAKRTGVAQFDLGPLGTALYDRDIRKAAELSGARRIGGGGGGGGGSVIGQPGTVGKPLNITDPETLAGRRDALIQRGRDMGMTANQALVYAEKNLAVDTSANKGAAERVNSSRERALLFDEITSTARAGVDAAGMTGGALGGLRERASRVAAVFSPEQQAKQDAVKLLDSVKPDIVKIGRSPGAVTEKENQILIGAGPSSSNTPSENEKIIRKMEVIGDLEQEYADFVESYIAQKGSAVGADSLWIKYKEKEVFKNGRYNENRVPIYDYLSNVTERNLSSNVSATDQKLLDAGFVRGPGGGWVKP